MVRRQMASKKWSRKRMRRLMSRAKNVTFSCCFRRVLLFSFNQPPSTTSEMCRVAETLTSQSSSLEQQLTRPPQSYTPLLARRLTLSLPG